MKQCAAHACRSGQECHHVCITLDSVTVKYGRKNVVEDVNFSLSCGELTAIVGPNGGGKSSILKAIIGKADYNGRINLCSKKGRRDKAVIGYVPQHAVIQKDSPVNVIDLMLLSEGYLSAWFYAPSAKKNRIMETLSLVSAENLAHRKIGELSGGEMQRVLLACSLRPLPDLLLLDEPVSAVDHRGMEQFYEIICDLRRRFHMAILLVSHDIGAIAKHADSIILLNKKVLSQGNPSDVIRGREFQSNIGIINADDIAKDRHTPEGEQ